MFVLEYNAGTRKQPKWEPRGEWSDRGLASNLARMKYGKAWRTNPDIRLIDKGAVERLRDPVSAKGYRR